MNFNKKANNVFERDTDCNRYNSRIRTDEFNSYGDQMSNQSYFGEGTSNRNMNNVAPTVQPNIYDFNNYTTENNYRNSFNAAVPSDTNNNRYIQEHLRNRSNINSQTNATADDMNRKTVKNASVIADNRRVVNNEIYAPNGYYNGSQPQQSRMPNNGYNSNANYTYGSNNSNQVNNYTNKPIANPDKPKREPVQLKTIVFIALFVLIVVVIATMIVVNCFPTASAQTENGQNSVNQVYEESALNKYIDSEGNTVDMDLAPVNPSYDYDTKTNWFDKLCDWMENIGR